MNPAVELRNSLIPPENLPKLGEIIGEKYRVEGVLGSGGMSAVFKVSHCVTKKCFALKWMLPSLSSEADAVARFIREAQVAGRFDHPNVVEVYDFGSEGDSLYMVMEFLEGENLASRIAKGPLSAEQACAILLPTARAVATAHAAGVIHRDLKPQNIFLTSSPEGDLMPKVLDFGISKMTQLPGELGPAITAEGTIIGTPHYMAPEQICGQPIDERIDVYALGVILYEALTGDVPFPCNSYGDLILRITTESPKAIRLVAPATPLALVGIVARAMHRDRACRYGSMTELADALEQFAETLGYANSLPYIPTEPGVPTPWPRTPLSSETRPVGAIRNRSMRLKALRKHGIELGVVLMLLAGIYFWHRQSGVDRPAATVATEPEPKPLEPPKPVAAAVSPEPPAAEKPEESAAPVEPAPPVVSEPPPPAAPAAQQVAEVPRAGTPVRPVAGAKRPARPAPGAIAPAPAFANQPAAAASRRSTRRTHDLSQADF